MSERPSDPDQTPNSPELGGNSILQNQIGMMHEKASTIVQNCIQIETNGNGVTFISFKEGRIISETDNKELTDALTGVVNNESDDNCVLDFSKVEFCVGMAIGKIIIFNRQMRLKGRIVIMHSINDKVLEMLKMLRVDTVFEIQQSRESAIQELRKYTSKK